MLALSFGADADDVTDHIDAATLLPCLSPFSRVVEGQSVSSAPRDRRSVRIKSD